MYRFIFVLPVFFLLGACAHTPPPITPEQEAAATAGIEREWQPSTVAWSAVPVLGPGRATEMQLSEDEAWWWRALWKGLQEEFISRNRACFRCRRMNDKTRLEWQLVLRLESVAPDRVKVVGVEVAHRSGWAPEAEACVVEAYDGAEFEQPLLESGRRLRAAHEFVGENPGC